MISIKQKCTEEKRAFIRNRKLIVAGKALNLDEIRKE